MLGWENNFKCRGNDQQKNAMTMVYLEKFELNCCILVDRGIQTNREHAKCC